MKGALELTPDPDRDAKPRKFAKYFGLFTANQFAVMVLCTICRIPDPKYLFRVFAAMDREIEAIQAEHDAKRKAKS